MLKPAEIDDFLHLKLPEDETLEILSALTPTAVDETLFRQFIEAIRKTVRPVPAINRPVLDCCGTGGSGLSHFNTSTASAFVIASGGVPVIKFGNRAMSSASGSFDFLDMLGISSEQIPDYAGDMLDACNLVFMFAPKCYPALAPFNQLRRSLGIRTIFNFMGPLLNPFKPSFRVLGVSDAKMQQMMAEYLAEDAGTQKAWVVRAEETMDEMSPCGKTLIYEVSHGEINEKTVEQTCSASLPEKSFDAQENAAIFSNMLAGEDIYSWAYYATCVNAGAAFYVAGKAASLEEGTELAKKLIASGEVLEQLKRCRSMYGPPG